jgi:hypothetical protein
MFPAIMPWPMTVLLDIDNVTTIIIEEIHCLFQTCKEGHSDIMLRDNHFRYY